MRKGLRVLSLMALALVAVTAAVRISLSNKNGNGATAGGQGWGSKTDAFCSNLSEQGDRHNPICGGDRHGNGYTN